MDKLHKLHAGNMEIAVAKLIGYRTHVIVPNVSWGLGLRHEADMLVLDSKNRLTEIEISKADLKKDLKKRHGHLSSIISRLVYAVPVDLAELANILFPKHGLIVVSYNTYMEEYEAKWVKKCRYHNNVKLGQELIEKLMHLGCMRIWSLKERLYL